MLFGTPEVSGKEWDDVVLKITLATTESEDCIPQRRDEVRKALTNVSPSLITTTERFRTFGDQYEILAICEGKPVPNLGYIVS